MTTILTRANATIRAIRESEHPQMATYFRATDGRSTVNVIVGYVCLAMAGIMGSLADVGWYDKVHVHGAVIIKGAGLLLVAMGFLAYLNRQTLDAIVFFAGGLANWAYEAAAATAANAANAANAAVGSSLNVTLPPGQPLSYQGWFFGVCSILFICAWLASLQSGRLRQLFLLGTSLSYVLAAVACWWAVLFLQQVVGYLTLATSVVACVIAGSEAIAFSRRTRNADREHPTDYA